MKRLQHSLAPVDTIAGADERLEHSDCEVLDGEMVWVRSMLCPYVYRVNSGLTPNGTTIVASKFAPGVWVQLTGSGGPVWMNQLIWFIDPVAGNDANQGDTPTAALKTDAERQRRMGPDPMWSAGEYHIHYLNDLPRSDPVFIVGTRTTASVIYVHGSVIAGEGKSPPLYAGKIDASTAMDRSSNTACDITSNGIVASWTLDGLLNMRVKQTTGANAGMFSWIVKDLTGKKARVAQWIPEDTFTGPLIPALLVSGVGAASNGADIIVEDLVKIPQILVDIRSAEDFSVNLDGYGVVLESLGLGIGTGGYTEATFGSQTYYLLEGCLVALGAVDNGAAGWMGSLINCQVYGGVVGGGALQFYGGYTWLIGLTLADGVNYLDFDFLSQAVALHVQGGRATLAYVCVFDSDTGGIQVEGGSMITAGDSIFGGSGQLWGADNSEYGVEIAPGAWLSMTVDQQTAATIVGNLGELMVGNDASVSPWDQATLAYLAAVALSWAALVTAVGAGGFGNQILHPGNGARIGLPQWHGNPS